MFQAHNTLRVFFLMCFPVFAFLHFLQYLPWLEVSYLVPCWKLIFCSQGKQWKMMWKRENPKTCKKCIVCNDPKTSFVGDIVHLLQKAGQKWLHWSTIHGRLFLTVCFYQICDSENRLVWLQIESWGAGLRPLLGSISKTWLGQN